MNNFRLQSTILLGSDVFIGGRIHSYKHHVKAEKVGPKPKQKQNQTSRDPIQYNKTVALHETDFVIFYI